MSARVVKLACCLVLLGGCAVHDVAHEEAPGEGMRGEGRSAEPAIPAGYVVQKGDSLYAIAFRYGLDYRELARWNDLSDPGMIFPGQRLVLHDPAGRSGDVGSTVMAVPAGPGPGAGVETRSAAPAQPTETAPAVDAAATPAAVASATGPAGGTQAGTETASQPPGKLVWRWPTEGTVVSNFSAGDSARQGIEIRGQPGQAVFAAAGGQVVYSGSGLMGYGELVIVKHDETFLSAYANNRRRLVAEGEAVRPGQPIAEMGQAPGGDAELHFEIRRDGRPVDPLRLLPNH